VPGSVAAGPDEVAHPAITNRAKSRVRFIMIVIVIDLPVLVRFVVRP